MIDNQNTKTQPITKEQVWEAYLQVRKKGNSSGVDQLTLRDYEAVKGKELYKVWNRMASGSYFPPPVRRVVIPKGEGGSRKLGIPTVNDRVAQMVVRRYLEPKLERIFHKNSYGYRTGRGAHMALQQTREQCWKRNWVIDIDIQCFFDNLDHELLMKALHHHVYEKWIVLYIERWLKAPIDHGDGKMTYPEQGSPQGGVISPLLSNLFLHYAFDRWMELNHPTVFFERYADDMIVHCSTREQAEGLLKIIEERMKACKLSLHPTKTRIVYCKQEGRKEDYPVVSFDFLGFTFKPKKAQGHDGRCFLGFGPVMSRKSATKMIAEIRGLGLHRRTNSEITTLAELVKSKLTGWFQYYGRLDKWSLSYVMFKLNERLIKWASKRFKRFKRSKLKARKWLINLSRDFPNLFYHWQLGFKPC